MVRPVKTLLRPTSLCLSLISLDAMAEEAAARTDNQAEPAGFFLMVLGLGALLLGMRNLRELRHKRMLPPRPRSRRPSPPGHDTKPSSPPPPSSHE